MSPRPRREVTCHAERPHFSNGLCKECYRKGYAKEYYWKHRDKLLSAAKVQYKENQAAHKERCSKYRKRFPHIGRNRQLKRLYGITLDDFNTMLVEQNNKCKLCLEEIVDRGVVDHCHTKGTVRGIVHQRCNLAIGAYESYGNLRDRIANYLQESNEPTKNIAL